MTNDLKIDNVNPTLEHVLLEKKEYAGLNGSDGGGVLLHAARTLAAYALNTAYGATLAPYERDNLIALARSVGCTVKPYQLANQVTRNVLNELLLERRKQIELGYTADYDDAHPMHARMETLDRLNDPNYTRAQLVEAGTIVVAEIERMDRCAAAGATPLPRDPVEAMESLLENQGIPT